jgi:Ca2+:H+ antiporter
MLTILFLACSIALVKVCPLPLLLTTWCLTGLQNEIRIVQASLLGSILANLLLILGMAFTAGGLRFREQV